MTSPAKPPFTKGEVNRAGALLLDLRERINRDGAARAVAAFDLQRLDEAWEALSWWTSLYRHPLSLVAANLRYHVDRADGQIGDQIKVAQRLKPLTRCSSQCRHCSQHSTEMNYPSQTSSRA